MDKIFIENISVAGKHGVEEHERRVEQEFIFDVLIEAEIENATRFGRLADTIDYGSLLEIVKEVVGGRSIYLIERLAGLIVEKIFALDGRIQSVSVTVRKPQVYPNAVPGVTITRKK